GVLDFHLALGNGLPEAITGEQECVTWLEINRVSHVRLAIRCAKCTEQAAAVLVEAKCVRLDMTRVDQSLRKAVITSLRGDAGAAEMVEARVAHMRPSGLGAGDEQHHQRSSHLRKRRVSVLCGDYRFVGAIEERLKAIAARGLGYDLFGGDPSSLL